MLASFTGDKIFNALVGQNKAISRIVFIRQDVNGMAFEVKGYAEAFLEILRINDPSFTSFDKAEYLTEIHNLILESVIPRLDQFANELKEVNDNLSEVKTAL